MAEDGVPAGLGLLADRDQEERFERRRDSAAGPPRTPRVAVVGMSVSPTCGVRAHAGLLAEALEGEDVCCSLHWLNRSEASLGTARREVRAWTASLLDELRRERPDTVLLHYSIFAYSHRGIPIFVRPTLSALRRAGIPVVAFMHELAFPWRLRGWRGDVWALTHRALLIETMRCARGAIVTTEGRAEWLASRRWLPRRAVGLAPVFSNLPAPAAGARGRAGERPRVGLFGYSYDEERISLVLDAIGLVARGGADVELELLGAPGPNSELARTWLRLAAGREPALSLSFAGPLDAQALSDRLAACELLLFADRPGPSSRKGTLAGALASARPLIATDGPQSWRELAESDVALVVRADARALAAGIAELLADETERERLGARGGEFARERMGAARSAAVTADLLREVLRA